MFRYRSATYDPIGGLESAVRVENWRGSLRLVPSVKASEHDMKKLSGRLSVAIYNSYEATGPYSLAVWVTTSKGHIENGVAVEVTSAELRFVSGETRTILSREEPPQKGITAQRPADPRGLPAADYSHCEFRFPLDEKLVFKADERVRVVATVRIAGLSQEMNLDFEFKPNFINRRGWVAEQL